MTVTGRDALLLRKPRRRCDPAGGAFDGLEGGREPEAAGVRRGLSAYTWGAKILSFRTVIPPTAGLHEVYLFNRLAGFVFFFFLPFLSNFNLTEKS